jgi:hypothetical protein
MRNIALTTFVVAATLSLTAFSHAANPEVIELPAAMGKVTFPHKQHQDRLQDCTKCHISKEGGKIEGFGKEFAHNTCRACHTTQKKGPTSCKECHVK